MSCTSSNVQICLYVEAYKYSNSSDAYTFIDNCKLYTRSVAPVVPPTAWDI